MFDKCLKDEIDSMVARSLHTSYRKCVESAWFVEAIVATKAKPKETPQALSWVV